MDMNIPFFLAERECSKVPLTTIWISLQLFFASQHTFLKFSILLIFSLSFKLKLQLDFCLQGTQKLYNMKKYLKKYKVFIFSKSILFYLSTVEKSMVFRHMLQKTNNFEDLMPKKYFREIFDFLSKNCRKLQNCCISSKIIIL